MAEKIMQVVDDRSDTKWGHPELHGFWSQAGLPEMADMVHDPSLTNEGRQAVRDRLVSLVVEAYEASKDAKIEAFSDKTEFWIPGYEEEPDAPEVRVVVVTPVNRSTEEALPVVFFVLAGGLTTGSPEYQWAGIKGTCHEHNAVVVCAQYRLAPENKYPAAINDLHAAYKWMMESSDQLGIDPDRVVITGDSSGGHLSLALAFRLKRYGYKPRAVVARMPQIDDRAIGQSSNIYDINGWDGVRTHASWLAWLGPENLASTFVGPEAVPGHATLEDCKGLPPLFLHGCESDPDADDVIRFASLCRSAKVYTELHSWAGTNHMAQFFASQGSMPKGALYSHCVEANIKDALTNDLRREWI